MTEVVTDKLISRHETYVHRYSEVSLVIRINVQIYATYRAFTLSRHLFAEEIL